MRTLLLSILLLLTLQASDCATAGSVQDSNVTKAKREADADYYQRTTSPPAAESPAAEYLETEHLRAVPVTTLTDIAELEDMEFFKRNGMDGGHIRIGGKDGISRHRSNGSWFVEYDDGTQEDVAMTNPKPGKFVIVKLPKRPGVERGTR